MLTLVVIDAGLIAAFLLTQAMPLSLPKLERTFDLSEEMSLPTWFSSMQLFVAFSLFAALTAVEFTRRVADARRTRPAIALLLLALAFLAMSVDEIVGAHEWLGRQIDNVTVDRADTPFEETGLWMFVVGIPFAVIMLALLYSLYAELDERHGLHLVVAGIATLIGGAAIVEGVENFVNVGVAGILRSALEEGAEMFGVTLVIWGALQLTHARLSINAVRVVMPEEPTRVRAAPHTQ